jgi:hypothetical protein
MAKEIGVEDGCLHEVAECVARKIMTGLMGRPSRVELFLKQGLASLALE